MTDGKLYYENNFVIGLVYQGDGDNFDGYTTNHYVQILEVKKANGVIHYWSWGGNNHSSNNSDGGTGVAELIIVKKH